MAKSIPLAVLAAASLALGAGSSDAQPPASEPISPRGAIFAAADAAPSGVPGTFAMQVAATGRTDRGVFLNSEADYRDQRNLTIAISLRAAERLAGGYGAPPEVFFSGRAIEVRGVARRVRIDFLGARGQPTGLYYYQTHVAVTDPAQIAVVD